MPKQSVTPVLGSTPQFVPVVEVPALAVEFDPAELPSSALDPESLALPTCRQDECETKRTIELSQRIAPDTRHAEPRGPTFALNAQQVIEPARRAALVAPESLPPRARTRMSSAAVMTTNTHTAPLAQSLVGGPPADATEAENPQGQRERKEGKGKQRDRGGGRARIALITHATVEVPCAFTSGRGCCLGRSWVRAAPRIAARCKQRHPPASKPRPRARGGARREAQPKSPRARRQRSSPCGPVTASAPASSCARTAGSPPTFTSCAAP